VNITLIPMGRPFSHAEMVQAAIDEGVPIIETAARNPQEYMDMIRASGAVHMHKCARVQDVVKAANLGAHMVTVVGHECGGHPGRQDVSTMVKVARATRAVDIPIAAGGGISDGRGLVAALSLGAEAVVMGTRFFAARECPAHDDIKAALVKADETSTGLVLTSLEPVRALRNSVLERVGELENKGASIAEMYPLVAGRRGLKAYMSGDADDALIPCGQGVGLIDDIPSVAELMERIMSEARFAAARVAELASDG
ncbi:MAG: nitronate monooxygenase, partial [Deltaproteobacteria bacterium]|nr:nitronate monooxygenase [Deltaproteobacteria bacterium]